MDEFGKRIAEARYFAQLAREPEPDTLYLGREEYEQMRRDADSLLNYRATDQAEEWGSMTVFRVDRRSHFAAVCRERGRY